MATYTVKIVAVCAGGEHITLRLYKDGVARNVLQATKSELMDDSVDVIDAIGFLCRRAIKDANAKTNAQRKAAIEGMVIDL